MGEDERVNLALNITSNRMSKILLNFQQTTDPQKGKEYEELVYLLSVIKDELNKGNVKIADKILEKYRKGKKKNG